MEELRKIKRCVAQGLAPQSAIELERLYLKGSHCVYYADDVCRLTSHQYPAWLYIARWTYSPVGQYAKLIPSRKVFNGRTKSAFIGMRVPKAQRKEFETYLHKYPKPQYGKTKNHKGGKK